MFSPRVLCLLLLIAVASPAVAAEVIVFKKDGRYKGAAMRILSIEEQSAGRLLVRGERGELFSAQPEEVDWELSRRLTLRMLEQEAARDAERAAKETTEARAAALAASRGRQMGVLEASRRYGVDNAAVSIAATPGGGVAASEAAPSGAAPSVPPKKSAAATAKSDQEMDRLKQRAGELEKRGSALLAELEKLKADNNPDPVSASLRRSQIDSKQKQLARIEKQLQELQEKLFAK